MRLRSTAIIIVVLFGLALAVPQLAQAFELKLGIVGNLPYNCRVRGDCNFCDFIGLFVILQKVILSLFGGLALIMLIWGGQSIIAAAGNSQKVAEAKKLIVSTLFGVLIVLAGYFLISISVILLASPRSATGKLESADSGILTWGNWQHAFCPSSTADADYCAQSGEGSFCENADGNTGTYGYCKGGVCVSECIYAHGSQNYSCKDIKSCDKDDMIGGDVDYCTAANECYPGLCPDPNAPANAQKVCCT